MLKMNYWTDKWDLHEDVCPCDVHFNQWVEEQKLQQQIDLSTSAPALHHVIGIEQARNGSGNMVFAITASKEEYQAYIDLVTERAQVTKSYLAYFGDIYLANPRLFPEFDVVTMFHLCEFFFPNTASAEYGGLTDRMVLDLFTDKTRPGGHILFYMRSMAFEKAKLDHRGVGEGEAGGARRGIQDAAGLSQGVDSPWQARSFRLCFPVRLTHRKHAVPTSLVQIRNELARANRILAHEGVLDGFGHVSVRHPDDPGPLSAVPLALAGIDRGLRHPRVHARTPSRFARRRWPSMPSA